MNTSVATNPTCRIEQLENRRMLCGDPGLTHIEPLGADLAQASTAEVTPQVQEGLAAEVMGAVAPRAGGARVIWGEASVIDGARVATWALVSPQTDEILAVGVSLPLKLVDRQPQQGGSGPAGAIASLAFPSIVQENTYFNHFELHTSPMGHPISPLAVNPDRNRVPHFDLHFYGISEAQVRAIVPTGAPLPPIPSQLLPAGYTQPGPVELIPQMGRHSNPAWALSDPNPLTTVMLAGFLPDASKMHFIEPMITREVFLQREDFTLPVPTPQSLGQNTLYPASFDAVFQGNSYQLIYSGFNQTTLAQPAAAADGTLIARTNPAPASFSREPIGDQQSVVSTIFGTDDALNPEERDSTIAEVLN